MTLDNLTIPQLLAAFAAFAGMLGLLQFLRVHRRRVRVSSTRLWRQLAEREKPRVLWQRWRDLLSYAAIALIGGLMLLALAGPALRGHANRRRIVVIVLDAGLSMQTREANGQKRLDLARHQAEQLVSQLGPDDRLAVITAGLENRALVPLSSYRPTMREALQKVEAADARADLPAALDLARAVASGQQNAEVVLISDRPTVAPSSVRAISVGARSDNAAITGLKITQPTVNNPQATAIITVTNSSSQALRCPLIATFAGKEVARTSIDQSPGATSEHSLVFATPGSGRVEIALAIDDPLPEDNKVMAQVVRPTPIRVLLRGSANNAVGRALRVDPELRVTVGRGDPRPYDVVVVDEDANAAATTPTLFAVPRAVANAREVRADQLLIAETSHPLMAGFAFKDVMLHSFVPLTNVTNSQPVALAGGQPVLVAGEDAKTHQRFIEAGWRLSDEMTGFPQRPQFVAFIGHAVRWLAGRPRERSLVAAIGERTAVEFSFGSAPDRQRAADLTLTLPSGATEKLGAVGEHFQFVPRQSGVHKFANTRGETVYLAAIREGAEVANIKPSGPIAAPASSRMASSPLPLWIYLAAAALLLLSAEWWAYLKRVTV